MSCVMQDESIVEQAMLVDSTGEGGRFQGGACCVLLVINGMDSFVKLSNFLSITLS